MLHPTQQLYDAVHKGIRTKYLDRYMIRMRMGGESTGSIKNIVRGNKNIFRAFRKNGIFSASNIPE